MTSLTLEALQAKHGDALLLTSEGVTVLIDGGPPGVYNQVLNDRLKKLSSNTEPAEIDLLIISHVDSDHIAGILDLTSDLIDSQEQGTRPLVDILEVWHNSFSDAIADVSITPKQAQQEAIKTASAIDEDVVLTDNIKDAKLVLSSVSQGRNLSKDLKTLFIDQNLGFKQKLVLRGNSENIWQEGELTLKVIGPSQKEVNKLRKDWAKQLPKILEKERSQTARVQAARSLDSSVFNLASIIVIAKVANKSMLLTGDARGDMIIDWLKQDGYENGKAHFDLIKLPHHGSDRNVDMLFFENVTADYYVVSGDGKHGNPEPETFRMLFKARGDEANYKILMTYSPDHLYQHKDYKKHDNDLILKEILNEKPGRWERLVFPDSDETSVSITL